jgi:hypothetical protein
MIKEAIIGVGRTLYTVYKDKEDVEKSSVTDSFFHFFQSTVLYGSSKSLLNFLRKTQKEFA